jgi:hypothetical protein
MSEKEARERAELHREANRAAAANTYHTPPLCDKTQGGLRGIIHGQRKAILIGREDVKPDRKP